MRALVLNSGAQSAGCPSRIRSSGALRYFAGKEGGAPKYRGAFEDLAGFEGLTCPNRSRCGWHSGCVTGPQVHQQCCESR